MNLDPNQHDDIPLSHQQRLMWTGQKLDPDSPIYNMAFWIELAVTIDESAFHQAFDHLLRTTANLRIVFDEIDGQPAQRIRQNIDFDLPVIDLSGEDQAANQAMAWCQERCQKMFDLSLRTFDSALVKVADDHFGWFINQHHIVSDAWSASVLFSELATAYDSSVSGSLADATHANSIATTPTFNRPACNQDHHHTTDSAFIDFYGNENNRLSSSSSRVSVLENDDELTGILKQLFAEPWAQSFSQELTQFNVLLTLYVASILKTSNQKNVRIGVPFHNRLADAEKQAKGLWIRFQTLEITGDENESFKSLLKKVQTTSTEYLKKATSRNQAKGTHADFNAVFNFINARFPQFAATEPIVHWLHPASHDREHHVRMHVQRFSDTAPMDIKFDLNNQVFAGPLQENFCLHFRQLSIAMADNPDKSIASIELSTETCQPLAVAPTGEPKSNLFTERLQANFVEFADQIAIIESENEITYSELSDRVSRITGAINSNLDSQMMIPICLPRSSAAVAAMLAVLQSGNIFVPMDPRWPLVRKQEILLDCTASIVISQSHVELPAGNFSRINLDENLAKNQTASLVKIDQGNSAYVIYTSGSTGKPKGVQISHASLAHYVNWASGYYSANQPVSFPLFTPLVFDLTLTSIFIPLATGGKVVVYPENQSGQDTSLLKVLDDDVVDVIKLTPSHLSLLSGQSFPDSRVKQLILGGENLKTELAKRTFRIFHDDLKIHNEYGPTEATVGCIVKTVTADSKLDGVSVPIGRPIPGMSALVLNHELAAVPTGVIGQLYLGGNGLAKGYVNRPELTQEKFFDSQNDSLRLYRTGDLVRRLPGGDLQYLGRQDNQVKIRGARIEIGAIETALRELDGIEDAVVTSYRPSQRVSLNHCQRCGLASNFPGITYDSENICDQCRSLEEYRDNAQAYFQGMDDLKQIFDSVNRKDQYDCLALLSGGKDSTYMLARLADMGLKILAFTLDNGYISEEAKANIRRVTQALSVDHHFGSTPHMNAIFVDSLKRFSNVCQGCFKTIYTLATNLALEKNIPFIVTGLSRGQFFETRLTAELFHEPCDNLVQIDESVLDARKAYHKIDDAVYQHLDVSKVTDKSTFDKVRYVDFYRYCDVKLDDMLHYLNQRLPWVRPQDTGRSTNCLINDVGIYVHQRNEGFHNYTLPYSWDVRMGHKTRDEAIDELRDRIDTKEVHRILSEIGYDGPLEPAKDEARLVAYVTAAHEVDTADLRTRLKHKLPDFMLPSKFIQIDAIPLANSGKTAYESLPDPYGTRQSIKSEQVAPRTDIENKFAEIWKNILGTPEIGITDNFFELGGDSILAIQIVAKANMDGLRIKPSDMFETLTIEKLAQRYQQTAQQNVTLLNHRQTSPSPIQSWMLEHHLRKEDYWTQSIELQLDDFCESQINGLAKAIGKIIASNQSLRTHISIDGNIRELPASEFSLPFINARGQLNKTIDEHDSCHEDELCASLRFDSGTLLAGRIIQTGGNEFRLLLMANHVATDAISFQRIVDDIDDWYASNDREQWQPAPSNSFGSWTKLLQEKKNVFVDQLDYWQQAVSADSPIPHQTDKALTSNSKKFKNLSASLSEDKIRKIEEQIKLAKWSVNELLIAACSKSLASVFSRDNFRVFVEGHGREDLDPAFDFSRTTGWFTSLYPVRMPAVDGPINGFKETLRQIPTGGIGYGYLRYNGFTQIDAAANESAGHDILFNFLGKTSAVERQTKISRRLKLHRSPELKRKFAVEIAIFLDVELQWDLTYRQDLISDTTASQLSNQFARNIEELGSKIVEDSDSKSVSDFPLADLDSRQLGNLAAILNQKNKPTD